MPSPNIEKLHSTNHASRWLFAGHSSSNPEVVSALFQGQIKAVVLLPETQSWERITEGVDAIALLINAKSGVSKEMIDFWGYISERGFPRLVIVNGLEFSEIDFDDIVLIANRVLEQVATPYLVLHDELGEPSGLICLSDLQVHDYSGGALSKYLADDELVALVSDFKDEFEEQYSEFEDSGFVSGLFVPALPLGTHRPFGINEIQSYLNQIIDNEITKR